MDDHQTEKQYDVRGKNPKEPLRNQYHPALCNAMELALYSDRDLLEFQQALKMNTLPREIDFLVIRKEKEGKLRNELASFFRRINIWEFKGYEGSLNVSVFYKAMSYAYEYLESHKELQGIEEITLSFLREGWPRNLKKWFADKGFERVSSPGWLARYKRDGYPDIQIVNIAHSGAPVFLRILSHKAKPEDVKQAAENVGKMPDDEKKKARLVMELSFRINGDERGGDEMGGFFETYVDPLNEIIEKQDEQIKEQDAQMKKQDAQMKEKDAELKKERAELRKKDELIKKLSEEIKRLGGSVAAL